MLHSNSFAIAPQIRYYVTVTNSFLFMGEPQTVAIKARTIPFSLVLPAVAFVIPLLVSGPQLLTGSLVNAFLLLAAMQKVDIKSRLAVAMLPSVGAVLNGVLFGTFTPFLLYLIPFIWVGNLVLMHTYTLVSQKLPHMFAVIAGAWLKTSAIFMAAFGLFAMNVIPRQLVNSMGIMQLITALVGGTGALAIMSYLARNDRR